MNEGPRDVDHDLVVSTATKKLPDALDSQASLTSRPDPQRKSPEEGKQIVLWVVAAIEIDGFGGQQAIAKIGVGPAGLAAKVHRDRLNNDYFELPPGVQTYIVRPGDNWPLSIDADYLHKSRRK